MQNEIEFTLNGKKYSAGIIPDGAFKGMYCWSIARDEGNAFPTLLEAQQDAINWEAGRANRYRDSEEESIDLWNAYQNQRHDDARYEEAEHG